MSEMFFTDCSLREVRVGMRVMVEERGRCGSDWF